MDEKCCGKAMTVHRGPKLKTDERCKRGKAVRHASDGCVCSYERIVLCRTCRRQFVSGSIVPYILLNVFNI